MQVRVVFRLLETSLATSASRKAKPSSAASPPRTAANRDPRLLDDPDALRLARGTTTHVAFGNGMHHCLGAPLARLEGQIVFDRLARRFPAVELGVDQPPYPRPLLLRCLDALPVALGADAGPQDPG